MSQSLTIQKKKGFLDYFPPPKFLEMPTIGVHISDTDIRFMELVKSGDSFIIGKYGRRKLPPAVIEAGYLKNEANKEEVRKILVSIKDQYKIKFINASLPEEKAYLFKTDIPAVSKKEIRSTLEFSLEENVPIPANNAVFDYSIIGDQLKNSNHYDVGVSVLPEDVVSGYMDLFTGAGLMPLSFEIEAQAMGRAVIDKGDKGAYLILNFEEFKTGLSVISDEVVQYASTVDMGGRALTEAIAKHFSVSVDEAEKIKKEKGFLRDKKDTKLFFSLMDSIAPLKNEIVKVLTYWKTRQDKEGNTNRKLEKIILCGKNSSLAGFDEFLSYYTKMQVEVANPWINVFNIDDYIPPIGALDSLDYATVIGLAMPKDEFSF
ncbi:MAG: pilus assembly protein PilM [Candidatus Paceibacterota bacterium]|jgi:type IV pilus assembly protein PilM